MDAGDLLGDIPLQICVELARVPVTADDVVSLRAGRSSSCTARRASPWTCR
ncbi:hypothetical protein ACN28S_08230 [Cystobacter fuscus]